MIDLSAPKTGNQVLDDFQKSSQAWLENSPVCTKVIDPNYNLVYMSNAGICALEIEDINFYYGKQFPLEFYPKHFSDSMRSTLDQVKNTGKTSIHEGYLYSASKKKLWFESTVSPIFKEDGDLDYFMVVSVEINKRKEAEIKELMLKEIHHRIKNNLQIVSSLLSIQSSELDNEELNKVIQNSQRRIDAISLVHEKLYLTDTSGDLNVRDYIEELIANISSTYSNHNIQYEKKIEIDDFKLNIDLLVPCGLILNEIITNVFKHGFESNENPQFLLLIQKNVNEVSIYISDNGQGLNNESNKEGNMGMKLIQVLAQQIEAKIDMKSEREQGLSYSIKFAI